MARKRSTDVEAPRRRLDAILALGAAGASVYADYPGGSVTGMLMKDYRGKSVEQEIWTNDALGAQICNVLQLRRMANSTLRDFTLFNRRPSAISPDSSRCLRFKPD